MSELRLQVSAKKAVSVYGLRRFPVTLYADEWAKLLLMHAEITRFIRDHESELSFKSDRAAEPDDEPPAGGKTFSQVMGWQH